MDEKNSRNVGMTGFISRRRISRQRSMAMRRFLCSGRPMSRSHSAIIPDTREVLCRSSTVAIEASRERQGRCAALE